MVEATLAQENLDELHGRLSGCFARVEPLQQARKYIVGLMSDLPRKNCWTISEHAGDARPDRMQRLLNDAVWETTTAMGVIRRFVSEHLAPPVGGLAVAALDETGQEKKGSACAGDEVYGRCGRLRQHLEDHQIGYVLRVGCAFTLELNPATRLRVDTIAATHLAADRHWQTVTVPGSKGERSYAWAWVATTSPRHFLLIRRHHLTGELAYHYCYIPPGRPVTLATLVAVACLRWPVEEDLCATRRSTVFPVQPGGTRREVSGSDGLPGAERLRGQEHARKPAAGSRCPGRRAGRPA